MQTKKRTVVIGGSSGMGLAIAQACYEKGEEVIIASRSLDKLKKAQKQIGSVQIHVLDATQEKELSQFFSSLGYLDHLVTTAADFVQGPFTEMTLETAKRLFDSKFWSQYLAAKQASPYLRKGGTITFFSGAAAQKPIPHFASGCAINAAIEGLARALAVELSPIRVNVISPGTIVTPVWDSVPEKERLAAFAAAAQELPVKRVGQPEDIARAVRYLIECGFATGSVVYVDGGFRLV
jgi:NAD(P)-dependent dehydrogenase (short-subunit alcohol dehydrogenase family)